MAGMIGKIDALSALGGIDSLPDRTHRCDQPGKQPDRVTADPGCKATRKRRFWPFRQNHGNNVPNINLRHIHATFSNTCLILPQIASH